MGQADISPIGGTEKRDKFINAAESRVNKALKSIDALFLITNAELYDYTEIDHRAIIGALNKKVELLNSAFTNKGPVGSEFTLEK